MSRSGRNPKSPAFQFYPGDFLSDPKVQAMSAEQVGAYLLLLCAEWLDGPLPDDPGFLARVCRLDRKHFDRAWIAVGRCFKNSLTVAERIENPRMERERLFQTENRARMKDISKKGVEARQEAPAGDHTVVETQPRGDLPIPDTLRPTPDTLRPIPESRSPTTREVAEDKPRRERKPATGPVADCIRHWESEWTRTRLGTKATIQAKDGVAVAWMTKQVDDPREVQRRMTAILEDPDPWLAQNACLPLLRSKWDRFACKVIPLPARATSAPVGLGAVESMMRRAT